ncbi:hypothetical protein FSP39_001138 [Pinctada imbricata]|uniref:Reverse transcriptase domain-containing protein n=1 Tax=Pinctada imbricata TaxID=66713 RepID=A0AA89C6B0_PINIB|nr:hypothetical protein FSP39_001138 [Pinctada imbricata]
MVRNLFRCIHIRCYQKWVQIPLFTVPEPDVIKNNKSARENVSFVKSEICKLLEKGCVSDVDIVPEVVNPLTVAFNREGKARLVLDCRHINLHVFKFKFKLEDASIARNIFQAGDFVFTFDLKSAYHHLSIHDSQRKYLGFACHFSGDDKIRYFVFNVLPFGISSASHIFTKLMRQVVMYLRTDGIKIVLYLDDGLGGANSYAAAKELSMKVRNDLVSLEFLIADEKCDWEPSHTAAWLGLCWNLATGTLRISEARIDRLSTFLGQVITEVSKSAQVLIGARRLAALAGQIISMQIVFGTIARLRTRYIFMTINSKESWSAPVLLNSNAFDEILYWKENSVRLNCTDIGVQTQKSPKVNIYSDASHSGYGGYIADVTASDVIGTWSESESLESSTCRELEAIRRVFNSLAFDLKGSTIKWCTDSQNAAKILEIGSRKPKLQNIASSIANV